MLTLKKQGKRVKFLSQNPNANFLYGTPEYFLQTYLIIQLTSGNKWKIDIPKYIPPLRAFVILINFLFTPNLVLK